MKISDNPEIEVLAENKDPFYKIGFWDKHQIMAVDLVPDDKDPAESEEKRSEVIAKCFIMDISTKDDTILGFEVMGKRRDEDEVLDVNELKSYLQEHGVEVSEYKQVFKIISNKFDGDFTHLG